MERKKKKEKQLRRIYQDFSSPRGMKEVFVYISSAFK